MHPLSPFIAVLFIISQSFYYLSPLESKHSQYNITLLLMRCLYSWVWGVCTHVRCLYSYSRCYSWGVCTHTHVVTHEVFVLVLMLLLMRCLYSYSRCYSWGVCTHTHVVTHEVFVLILTLLLMRCLYSCYSWGVWQFGLSQKIYFNANDIMGNNT